MNPEIRWWLHLVIGLLGPIAPFALLLSADDVGVVFWLAVVGLLLQGLEYAPLSGRDGQNFSSSDS